MATYDAELFPAPPPLLEAEKAPREAEIVTSTSSKRPPRVIGSDSPVIKR